MQHKEKFENVPEDLQPIEACDDAGFKRNVSLGHFFVAIHDIQMAGFGCTNSCREYSHLRNDHRSEPKGAIRGNTKFGPVLEVKVTKDFDLSGIEIKIDSLQKDGTQSWIVISRGVNKYATELLEENRRPINYEGASPSAGTLAAMEQKEQFTPSSSSSATLPIDQRKWNDILFGGLTIIFYTISKIMTGLLRHQGYLREDGGAIEWRNLLPLFYSDYPEVQKWTKQTCLNHPEKGSNKKRLQYCVDSYGYILHMRAIQGHSGGNKVDLSAQDTVEIPYNWIDHILSRWFFP